jgi:hypothetical protein
MSEHQVNQLTLWLVSAVFPLVGIAKLFLANVMVRNTHTRTRIGDWLVRMFVAIGVTFILIGSVYALAVTSSYGWLHLPVWGNWGMRLAAVCSVLLSVISTAMLVRHLLPLLQEVSGPHPAIDPPHVAKEIVVGFGMVIGASVALLAALMLLVDWV